MWFWISLVLSILMMGSLDCGGFSNSLFVWCFLCRFGCVIVVSFWFSVFGILLNFVMVICLGM